MNTGASIKISQVNGQVTEIVSQCEKLAALLSALHERLEPVLLYDTSENIGGDVDKKQDHLCPLADQLRNSAQGIKASIRVVDDILSHLEI